MKKIRNGSFLEILLLISIVGGFLALNLSNLKNWYFSAIGDEYAFFNFAHGIANGENSPNIFVQRGVYNTIPVFSSYYQAFWMKILGINVFGWKASHVILIASTIPAFYLLVKKLLNKITAFLATTFYASSHVIWAYTHTGYSNIESLFPLIFSLSLFVYNRFFLAGIFAGLAFYTYYISRVTIVIILFWIFARRKSLNVKKSLFQFLLGFSLLVVPFLVVNRGVFFQDMFARSVIGQNDPTYYEPRYKFVFDNIIRNGLAPWQNTKNMCYVSGSILDSITGLFLIIGLLILIIRAYQKKTAYITLGIFLFVSFLTIAIFSPYGYVAISRQFFIIPSLVITAGIGVEYAAFLIKKQRIRIVFILLVTTSALSLNYYRFFVQTPKVLQPTSEALTIKTLLSEPCRGKTNIVIGTENHSPFPLLAPALAAYGIEKTILLEYNQTAEINNYQANCVINLPKQ
jgi:4-amino-4-deoxy-L-arabinose transferase-like glycosyltransferase